MTDLVQSTDPQELYIVSKAQEWGFKRVSGMDSDGMETEYF